MSAIADVIARQVENSHWVWRLCLLEKTEGWKRLCSCCCHWDCVPAVSFGPPDYAFPIWRMRVVRSRYLFIDPATGEHVDDYEACRRVLLREILEKGAAV